MNKANKSKNILLKMGRVCGYSKCDVYLVNRRAKYCSAKHKVYKWRESKQKNVMASHIYEANSVDSSALFSFEILIWLGLTTLAVFGDWGFFLFSLILVYGPFLNLRRRYLEVV